MMSEKKAAAKVEVTDGMALSALNEDAKADSGLAPVVASDPDADSKPAETTKKKAGGKKKTEGTSTGAETKKKATVRKTNAFGHIEGSMSAAIDGMLSTKSGATPKEVADKLMEKFGRSDKKAASKVKSHIKHLVSKGFVITKNEKSGKVTLSAPPAAAA